jgi:hypothetical protein
MPDIQNQIGQLVKLHINGNRNLRRIAPLICIVLGIIIKPHAHKFEVNMRHRKLFCKFLSVLHADKEPIRLSVVFYIVLNTNIVHIFYIIHTIPTVRNIYLVLT